MLKFLLFFCALVHAVSATRLYNIVNNCPIPVTLYINGASQGTLASSGGFTTRTVDDNWSGFIYTDANQGNSDGSGTVRAGFFGEDNYYYLVSDPSWVNVGVSIIPIDRAPKGGFCLHANCEYENCDSRAAFQQPPTAFPPAQSGIQPVAPLLECPQANTGYTVTFCPSGRIPNLQTRANIIQPVGHSDKCLDVRGGVFANGTPVQIYDCNGSQAQKWVIKRGKGSVRVTGTEFCLDAGSGPANGVGMKIWQCFDGLAAQTWFYDGVQETLTLYNQGQCLDLTDGDLTNGRQAQIWQCTAGNANQVWDI
ncbi:G-X-X-X-Q-X-W domain-containing protein [Mycena belliarum]|uniref:G-X-X-X-Q-X-W domain-containing protein n=1 Tax=Mycena belliarum TaxID=1033014 RepID=A0AAD6U462_9AGAR|nr:G-X-X-X-Q-X-W domain-containing protein [Mycena belliae]